MRAAALAVLACLACAGSASSATVSVAGGTLRVTAAPGEANQLSIGADETASSIVVSDAGAPDSPVAGAGCAPDVFTGTVTCPADGVRSIRVDAGDGDDGVDVTADLPAVLNGGAGTDRLAGGPAEDVLAGGPGDDELSGGAGDDVVRAAGGGTDTVACGYGGRDSTTADVADWLDLTCERVDYGRAGLVGPVHTVTGGGRFVPIPGQGGARIDRRLLPDVLYLIRRYHVRIAAGFSLSAVHARRGEHPLGLAADILPGPGGSWNAVDRLARWAEPRQDHPRWPFRWVGYDGDYDHGRGNHLHLSWMHTPAKPGRPARTVWVFSVRR